MAASELLVAKRGVLATRISRPSSTNRQSSAAVMAPNWIVSCAEISCGRSRMRGGGTGAVGGEARRAGDRDLGAALDDPPVERRRHGAELDRVMRGNLLRPLRRAARLEISGRGNHDPPHLADMARYQR